MNLVEDFGYKLPVNYAENVKIFALGFFSLLFPPCCLLCKKIPHTK